MVYKVDCLPHFLRVCVLALADRVLPSVVCNGDDGPGRDDDCSIPDGEAGDAAELEDEAEEVAVAPPDDLVICSPSSCSTCSPTCQALEAIYCGLIFWPSAYVQL